MIKLQYVSPDNYKKIKVGQVFQVDHVNGPFKGHVILDRFQTPVLVAPWGTCHFTQTQRMMRLDVTKTENGKDYF